jgi:cell division protein FtsW
MRDLQDVRVRPSLSQIAVRVLRAALAWPLLSHRLLLYASATLLLLGISIAPHGSLPYLALGLLSFWFGQRLPASTLRQLSLIVLGLATVLLLGRALVTPSDWLVELTKIGLALSLADVAARGRLFLRALPVLLLPVGLAGFHDIGDLMVLLAIVAGALWAISVRRAVVVGLTMTATVGALLMVLWANTRSLEAALVGCQDVDCRGVMFSRAAFAEGGWFGVGLATGTADRFPHAGDQFVFASVGDELGAVGCLMVLAACAVLGFAGFRIAGRAADPFRRVAACALTFWLVAQALLHVGGVLAVLPLTGVALPLVSAPDAGTVATLAGLGVLAGFARAEPEAARSLHANPLPRWLRLLWAPLPPRI